MALACAAAAAALAGCGGSRTAAPVPGGDVSRGHALLETFGCGSCHTISGVAGADGNIGPPLNDLADRRYIAGRLPNTPDNVVRWIMSPQAVDPGNVMPDLGVGEPLARDITAYLYRH